MSEANDVTRARAGSNKPAGEEERAVAPAVDIFEDSEGIFLLSDMPGVSRDRLNIRVDSDTLAVEGKVEIPMPEGMEAAQDRSAHCLMWAIHTGGGPVSRFASAV